MNDVLKLTGRRFIQEDRSGSGGGTSVNGDKTVTTEHLLALRSRLEQIRDFWRNEKRPFNGLLISVFYNKIVAKSNRISALFKGVYSNEAVVGAKYNQEKNKHIITYYIDESDLNESMEALANVANALSQLFGGRITKEFFKKDENTSKDIIDLQDFSNLSITKSKFKQVIGDASYIDSFEIEWPTLDVKQSIITLYDVKQDAKSMLKELGIDVLSTRILNDNEILLDEKEIAILLEKAPYLVAMSTVNLIELTKEDLIAPKGSLGMVTIPSPTIEPTIGVIDTLFDDRVYFSEWVEYHDMVDKHIQREPEYCNHGTAVSSIIVDGPSLNPDLDDGCGRFKVRHFGVAAGPQFSAFTIIKQIRQIVAENTDIKVWNISLGSNQEVSDNYISAEAAILDTLQSENENVIFVIAGTNKPNPYVERIGSPADSINSMVVNSVDVNGKAPRYARKGIVLSFFAKPDVSYYGGSKEQYIQVCEPLGKASVAGTSYAAPWIARKLSYLMDILGFNREVAKAMIIDAARGWNADPTAEEIALYGHGVVPIHINDIIQSKDDEIKFIVTGFSEKWNTYNYEFPVPMESNKYPYIAKATMCYFPVCNRSQGVDYTNTELNLHIGRLGKNKKVMDIKGDRQNIDPAPGEKPAYIYESNARKQFRKWDNVKYVVEKIDKRMVPKSSYGYKNWGIEIKTNNRLNPEDGNHLRFGVVVTLKEMYGQNRINEFIKDCHFIGWDVESVNVQHSLDIRQKVQEEIEFE